ncbi:hypothetical protein VI817_000675 [Penicillium citrinum]|nr:hypothetical protein VI817_000675 [Penicillium citrinum]
MQYVHHYKPGDWWNGIQRHSKDYESLRVISLTRVKDLDSPWAHEYVQFIVEDIASKERARIYAERGTDKEMSEVVPWAAIGHNPFTFGRDSVDGITIGYNESKGIKFPPNKGEDKPKEENPKPIIPGRWGGHRDLPLPLEAFLYPDAETRPPFLDLAQTIGLVSNKGGQYNLLGHNCFWFAYTSMKDHGLKHEVPPKKVYYTFGGGTGRLRDLYSYHYTRKYKEYYRKNAEDFDKSRAGPIDGALPKSRGVTTPMSNIQALKGFLLDRDTMESYLEVLKENDISVTSTNVKEYLDEAAENAKEEENQAAELRYTEQFDKEVDDLEKKVVGAMSDEEKGEFYAKVEHDVATSAQDASGITAKDLDLDGPQAKRYYLVYELMEILADEVDAEAKAGTSYR